MKTALLLLLCTMLPVLSQEDSKMDSKTKTALELLETMHTREIMMRGFETGLAPAIEQIKRMGLPPEGVKELQDASHKFIEENFKWDEVKFDLAKMQCEAFTEPEMKEMIAFYKSPVGQKATKVTPDLMQESAKWAMARMQTRMGDLKTTFLPILAKYKDKLVPKSAGTAPTTP